MELLFCSEMTFKEINKKFQKFFPYLKLEFYNYDPMPEQLSLWKDCIDGNTRLGDVAGGIDDTTVAFEANDTIAELEKKFESQLGLYARVYQNINGVWYQTPRSGHLKLDKQNALGIRPLRYSYNNHTLFL